MKDTTGIKLINPYLYYRDLFRSLRDSIAQAEFGKTSAQFLGLVFLTLPMVVYSMFTFPFVNFQDLNDKKSAEPVDNERSPIHSDQLNAAKNQLRAEAEEIKNQIPMVLKSNMSNEYKRQQIQTLKDKAESINNVISSLTQQKPDDGSTRQRASSPNAQQASIQDQGSRLQDQGSRLQDQGSRLQDQGSRLQDQGSRLQDQGTSIKAQVARIRAQKEKYVGLTLKFLITILQINNSPNYEAHKKADMQRALLGKLRSIEIKVDNLNAELRSILSKYGASGTLNENNAALDEELNKLLSQDKTPSSNKRSP